MILTRNQMLSITLVILGVLMASTAQLNDLFGPHVTKTIVSLAGLLNSILAGVLAIITGQSGTLKDVAAMPGVERISVNSSANATLATLAVDPKQDKIAPTTAAETEVAATANAAK